MNSFLNRPSPVLAAATFLALGLTVTAASAQTAPKAGKPAASVSEATSPTNAELKQEVDSLREQVQKLQQALQDATPAQPHGPPAAATSKAKDGMPKGQQGMQKGMAKGNQGMQKGMGMMDDMDMPMDKDDSMEDDSMDMPMDKDDSMEDDSMEMPPPDAKKPDPMSGGMSDM